MAKSLDGIKKLGPEEKEKYRKIVLDYIGEKDAAGESKQKVSGSYPIIGKRIDGIRLNNYAVNSEGNIGRAGLTEANKAEPEELDLDDQYKQAVKQQAEIRRRLLSEESQYKQKMERMERERREQKIRQEEIRRAGEEARRENAEQALIKEKNERNLILKEQRELAEASRRQEEKRWQEKIKLEESEKEAKRKATEAKNLEKIKRKDEIRRLKQAGEMARRAGWEKKKKKRLKARRRFKKNLKLRWEKFYSLIKRNIIYYFLFLILCLAILYLVFCLAVLRLEIDNSIINKALKIIPVPAAVTSQGIIRYDDYKKIENASYLSLSLAEKNNYLVRWLAVNNLKKKYNLSAGASDLDIAKKFVLDKDYNRIGLSRINKISEFLFGQKEIAELSKYADEYNEAAYYDIEGAEERFGRAATGLGIGQISNIIPRVDGYYIVKRIDDNNKRLGFSYVFVRALNFEQYVNDLEKEYVHIFAN